MAKKSPTPKFIAIDNNEAAVIEIGNHDEVKDAIEEYAADRDMSADDVSNSIEVFEIGEKRMIDAITRGVEVMF